MVEPQCSTISNFSGVRIFRNFTVTISGGCMISPATEKSLLISAKLIGVDKEELREALVSRVMQATRGGVKGTAIK